MVKFKGICLRADQATDSYKVLPNKDVTVLFNDVNGKEIASGQVRTNDYGSFAGTFVAPRDRLTGRMWIGVQQDVPGGRTCPVEEYKRPQVPGRRSTRRRTR